MNHVFETAHVHVAYFEGNLSDHPADSGGVTRYGISLKFLQGIASTQSGRDTLERIGVRLPVIRQTILDMTPERAKTILRWQFWNIPLLYDMPPLIAACLYDCGINTGMGRAALLLQAAINNIAERNLIVRAAPNIGPLTRQYSWELTSNGKEYALAMAFLDAREAWYRSLTTKNPSQKAFLKGWLRRTKACRLLATQLKDELEV